MTTHPHDLAHVVGAAAETPLTASLPLQEWAQPAGPDYRTLVEAMTRGLICLDTGERVVAANAAAAELLGVRREQLIGRRWLSRRWRWTQEDGSPCPGDRLPWRVALVQNAAVRDVVVGFTRPGDGTQGWVSVDAVPVGLPGGMVPPSTLVTLSDVSSQMQTVQNILDVMLLRPVEALRQSEARLSFLLDETPTINWTTDRTLRLTMCRGGSLAVLGIDSRQIPGMDVRELLGGPGEDSDLGMAMHLRALAGESLSYEQAVEEIMLGVTLGPLRRDDGTIDGVMGVAYDLTEHHRLQQHLIQADKMATIGIMAAGIAHELRSPMTIISLNTGILLDDPPDVDLRKSCLERLRGATQRAADTISSLLKLAYPHSGIQRDVDVGALVEEARGLLEDHLVECGVELHTRLADPPLLVTGDAGLLLQVFMNLVINACEAMPEGGELAVSLRPEKPDMVAVAFADTGCGIDPEDIRHVFDPFFTTKPPATDTSAGVGLSICDHIVTRHGGRITVQSELGRGATFTVLLPRLRREAA